MQSAGSPGRGVERCPPPPEANPRATSPRACEVVSSIARWLLRAYAASARATLAIADAHKSQQAACQAPSPGGAMLVNVGQLLGEAREKGMARRVTCMPR